jgi:hypothetical protein
MTNDIGASRNPRLTLALGGLYTRTMFKPLEPLKDSFLSEPAELSIADLVANVIKMQRAGREIAAGLGLATLRNRMPAGDWPRFLAEHFPSTEAAEKALGRVVYRNGIARCRRCSAEIVCPCGCGAPYVSAGVSREPTGARALERAMAAIEANPGLSDRAISKQIGVSHQTVMRARRTSGARGPLGPLE